jgi:hypothetical protein
MPPEVCLRIFLIVMQSQIFASSEKELSESLFFSTLPISECFDFCPLDCPPRACLWNFEENSPESLPDSDEGQIDKRFFSLDLPYFFKD